jgi:MFS family permease
MSQTSTAPRRPLIVAAIMAGMFMIAIEATIVSTAMPQIAGQLGDLHLYSWVFAAFLLTQTATSVVFGRLADIFGRKPVLLAGIGILLVGSVLCGLAGSMIALVVYRLIQGAGAGAIQPVAITVIGDLYPARERGKVTAYTASMWGAASILGPLAGGLILQHLSWAWIFWINVPVGLASAAGFIAWLHETRPKTRQGVDIAGAVLFTTSIAALMVAITQVGTGDTETALIAALICLGTGALFVLQERRARHPMLSFSLWGRRPIATTNAATLLSGVAIIGLTTFVPMYVQAVLNRSALVAGFALTMMVMGWPVGATLAARNFGRFGLRGILLFGAAVMPAGAIAFVLLDQNASPVLAGTGSIVMGLGMGFFSTAAIVLIQDSVGWAERGAATASNLFARNLGSALGATILGGVLNVSLAHGSGSAGVSYAAIRRLLDNPGVVTGDAAVRATLGQALHLTFCAVFVVAALTLALSMLVPEVALSRGARPVPAE